MLVMLVFLMHALNQSEVMDLDYQENSDLGWGFLVLPGNYGIFRGMVASAK
ncbi:MAG: hypothetical protein U5L01_11715 [Rheinheimera sp.]|nr:hypothetical protein [Rheinheimera sp.]